MADAFPYRKPVVEIKAGELSLDDSLVTMHLISDLNGIADTVQLEVEDFGCLKREQLQRGQPLTIRWGYQDDQVLQEIFRGVIQNVDRTVDPLVLNGIDYNAVLNATKILKTFQDETASGILQAMINETDMESQIEDCDLEIPSLPFFNISVRKCIDRVTSLVFGETGESFVDYIREGVFHWERKKFDQEAVVEFRTGENIISFRYSETGFSLLETMVCPVLHSQVIRIDDNRWYVNRADYHWNQGGRTQLWVQPCG